MMLDKEKKIFSAVFGAALCFVFFFAYSFLPLTAPGLDNSPDEASNRFFAENFFETGYLWHFEPLNLKLDGAVHPRSMRVVDDFIVPGGFLGLPVIFGGLARAFGKGAIPFLTPFFAVLGVISWGLLVRRFFGSRIGLLSAVLLFVNPAWWYESSRTLMPNVLFVSLALMGTYFLLAAPLERLFARRKGQGLGLLERADGPFAGIFLGFAVAVRPAELYWIVLVALILLVMARPIARARVILFVGAAAMVLLPFLFMQKAVYGNFLSTGYGDAVGIVPETSLPQGMGARLLGPAGPYLFPLGFAPRTAWSNFMTYGLSFFWWWTALVIAGLFGVFASERHHRDHRPAARATRIAAVIGLTLVLWLVHFYGSWSIQDNPDPTAVSIGSSYIRYWLPLFVLSTLPVAWLLERLGRKMKDLNHTTFLTIVFAVLAVVSGHTVFNSDQEGLETVRKTLLHDEVTAQAIFNLTEEHSVIIVDRADKMLFPERAVMTPLRSEHVYGLLPQAVSVAPLYYFGITFPEKDIRHLRETRLEPVGLRIGPVAEFGQRTLYSIK